MTMTHNPKVAIIVPIYNVEKYLRECLDSVLAQSYQNLEIVLVDDGSTDSSGVIAREYFERDSRVSLICKTNGGLSSARNAGIELVANNLNFEHLGELKVDSKKKSASRENRDFSRGEASDNSATYNSQIKTEWDSANPHTPLESYALKATLKLSAPSHPHYSIRHKFTNSQDQEDLLLTGGGA